MLIHTLLSLQVNRWVLAELPLTSDQSKLAFYSASWIHEPYVDVECERSIELLEQYVLSKK